MEKRYQSRMTRNINDRLLLVSAARKWHTALVPSETEKAIFSITHGSCRKHFSLSILLFFYLASHKIYLVLLKRCAKYRDNVQLQVYMKISCIFVLHFDNFYFFLNVLIATKPDM